MSARELLRVGVVGVGHLGRHHARILSSLPGAALVAAVDLEKERAQAAVAGTTAEALTDYRALFDRADAVTIAVPTVDHLRVASAFLERGIHVLVEKPMTASLRVKSAWPMICQQNAATSTRLAASASGISASSTS